MIVRHMRLSPRMKKLSCTDVNQQNEFATGTGRDDG